MCAGGSCILILDRDDNGIELEVLFFPIYFSRMAYTYCYGLIGNTFEIFGKFLEMHVGKNVLGISNTLSIWQEIKKPLNYKCNLPNFHFWKFDKNQGFLNLK